jgi:hypothetical protein
MHTLLDLRGNIPTFIRVTDGKVHDVHMLDEIESVVRDPKWKVVEGANTGGTKGVAGAVKKPILRPDYWLTR